MYLQPAWPAPRASSQPALWHSPELWWMITQACLNPNHQGQSTEMKGPLRVYQHQRYPNHTAPISKPSLALCLSPVLWQYALLISTLRVAGSQITLRCCDDGSRALTQVLKQHLFHFSPAYQSWAIFLVLQRLLWTLSPRCSPGNRMPLAGAGWQGEMGQGSLAAPQAAAPCTVSDLVQHTCGQIPAGHLYVANTGLLLRASNCGFHLSCAA